MPIRQSGGKWYWGSQGPFDSREKAEQVAAAAHASGFQEHFSKRRPRAKMMMKGRPRHG